MEELIMLTLRKKAPSNKRTHEEYIELAREKFGSEYEFLSKYDGIEKDIKIKHVSCGHIWQTRADRFLSPRNKMGIPCPECKLSNKESEVSDSSKNENKVSTKERIDIFLDFVDKKLGYEYIAIFEYHRNEVKFKLKHSKCGDELQIDLDHLIQNGVKCKNPKCSKTANKYNFKELVFQKYGSSFIVLDEYVHSETPVLIKHNEDYCGKVYERIPKHFLNGKGLCPYCKPKSKYESKISDILSKNDINFKREFKFIDCKDRNSLRFDFAIFDKYENLLCLIEYDGEQHYEPVDFARKGQQWADKQFSNVKQKDAIKNQYCIDNNIPLFRIPYWEKKNIKEIVSELINNKFTKLYFKP